MHFEILVEGSSEKLAMDHLIGKILSSYGSDISYQVHQHRGNGELPANPKADPDPKNPTLLHNLPSKLRAYGKSLDFNSEAVIVLVDLDCHGDCYQFKQDLVNLLKFCPTKPRVLFRIAIEELEAWYFGDREAILAAYPKAKVAELKAYQQDFQDRTWERLADAVVPGGHQALRGRGRSAGVREKVKWSKKIPPFMNVEMNLSPSFQAFRDGLRKLASELK